QGSMHARVLGGREHVRADVAAVAWRPHGEGRVHGARVPPFQRLWQSGNKWHSRNPLSSWPSMGPMSSMSRATPDPDRAFRALARRLTARRAHELGARLWFVLGVLALSVAAFTYWQVR